MHIHKDRMHIYFYETPYLILGPWALGSSLVDKCHNTCNIANKQQTLALRIVLVGTVRFDLRLKQLFDGCFNRLSA